MTPQTQAWKMKIAILGSTGFLGKVLLEKALNAGYQVRTLVRNQAKLGQFKDRVELVEGNIFRASDIEEAVLGTEAVLSTVGPPQRNPKHPQKYEQAMKDLVAAMDNHKIKRLIHVGGSVHLGGEDENWTEPARLYRRLPMLRGWSHGKAKQVLGRGPRAERFGW